VVFVVRRRWFVLTGAALLLAISIPAYLSLGWEFMPPLNEGTLLYMPTAPPGIAVGEASRILQQMDRELHTVPEVVRVFGKIGRAETPTDPAPLSMVETLIQLAPRERWRPGLTWDGLVAELDAKLHYPGMPNLWWMPIQTRTEMLATGVRSQLGVKVFGANLAEVEQAAIAVAEALRAVPGTRNAFAERATGAFYLDVRTDRARAARYGVSVEEVNDALAAAIGGAAVSQTIQGRERYAIQVRYAREFRSDPEAVGNTLVPTSSGALVPLRELADLSFTRGPDMVRSEAGQLVGLVAVDVAGRPIVDYVKEAQRVVAQRASLPTGTRIAWVGQFEYFERAKSRLLIVLPLTLALVALLLYLNTRSAVETAMVMLAVPFSLIGAIWLLVALGYNMSIAVVVGFIALAGLDAQTGVVMLLYLSLAWRERAESGRLATPGDLEEAIVEGAARRIRPKLMTVATMMLGLLPLLWSSGTGADVMKRIAAPMVGGLVSSFALELLVYPALFALWKGRSLGSGTPAAS
jgi:Cu(I)/Ag(I) efflux system membrane protein CusA/SilA